MSTSELTIDVPIDDVFDILTNPSYYDRFVPGARTVRRFDAHWPEPGSALHHKSGFWPVSVWDKTVVLEVEPPTRLVVRPHVRPLLISDTKFELLADGERTHVVVVEYLVGGMLHPIWCKPLDALMAARNQALLHRLARLAENHHRIRRQVERAPRPRPTDGRDDVAASA